jgi:hypothetical protein
VYRIHIFATEYEYILNILEYILGAACSEKEVVDCAET